MATFTFLQAVNEDEQRKGKNDLHIEKDFLHLGVEDFSVQNEKMYQLYTLYRDTDGKIRQVSGACLFSFGLYTVIPLECTVVTLSSQAKVNGCCCKPLYKKLEGQLKVTQEDMKLHILNIREQVNSSLGKMGRRTQHQVCTDLSFIHGLSGCSQS